MPEEFRHPGRRYFIKPRSGDRAVIYSVPDSKAPATKQAQKSLWRLNDIVVSGSMFKHNQIGDGGYRRGFVNVGVEGMLAE